LTMLNSPLIRAQIATALNHVGAKTYEVVRTPTDANGQPNGAPEVVGKLYGKGYIDNGGHGSIHIDLPGIVAGHTNKPTMTALKLCGEDPQAGDIIRCGSQETKALSATSSGPVHTLTLERVI
jgi:hypothetical protein